MDYNVIDLHVICDIFTEKICNLFSFTAIFVSHIFFVFTQITFESSQWLVQKILRTKKHKERNEQMDSKHIRSGQDSSLELMDEKPIP